MYKLVDFVTKKEVVANDLVFAGEKNPWEVVMDMERVKRLVNKDYFLSAAPSLLKYLPVIPLNKPGEFVSLRENATPLIKSKRLGPKLGINLYFKLEGKNPTGSFKDRGSAVDISVAKEMGAKAVILASTGNMAASCACYAAAAGLLCFVVVPEDVPMSKLAQVMSYGGKLIQVKGSYNDAAKLAYDSAKVHGFYLAGDYAFRVEGQKTAAFELLDQLSCSVPDRVVLPIGCGTNVAAYGKGFDEYQSLGMIDRLPKVVGVQSTGANAVVNSFRQQSNTIEKLPEVNTVASAIAVPDPIDGAKALDVIRRTQGEAYDVTDEEILQAQHLLSTEEGLFVESAGAATVAYLLKKVKEVSLKGETVVCVLTGDGLKDPNVVLKSAIKPPTIAPSLEAFTNLYESNFFDSKTMHFTNHDKVLLFEPPNHEQLNDLLLQYFDIRYEKNYLKKVYANVFSAMKKGKDLSLSDLQDLVQDALEQPDVTANVFSVEDFTVSTLKDNRSTATVTVRLKDELYEGSSDGVGPVDAAVQAACNASHDALAFELKNYNVDIRSHGTDAVVYVEMKLHYKGLVSLGRSASPDIIQASLAAFENAYNGLFSTKGREK